MILLAMFMEPSTLRVLAIVDQFTGVIAGGVGVCGVTERFTAFCGGVSAEELDRSF